MGEPATEMPVAGTTAPQRRGCRRVFIRDARENDHYLRATWHPERQVIVVSTWRDEVCTGAVRLPVQASGDLANLIVDGLAEASAHPPPPVRTLGPLERVERRLRDWRRWIGRPPR